MEMHWFELVVWGTLGGFIIDGLEFWKLIKRNGGQWPVEWTTPAFAVAEVIRLIAGAALAVAFGLTDQVSGPVGVLAIGAAAPLVAEKLAQTVPALPANNQ